MIAPILMTGLVILGFVVENCLVKMGFNVVVQVIVLFLLLGGGIAADVYFLHQRSKKPGYNPWDEI
jgi:hypothetical protein